MREFLVALHTVVLCLFFANGAHAEKQSVFGWIINGPEDLAEINDVPIQSGLMNANSLGVAMIAISAPFYNGASNSDRLKVAGIIHRYRNVHGMVIMVYAPADPGNPTVTPSIGDALSLLGGVVEGFGQPCTSWLAGRVVDKVGGEKKEKCFCTTLRKPPTDNILPDVLMQEAGSMHDVALPLEQES